MRITAALFVLISISAFGQNAAPPPQALTYPRRPPKEWTAEFKDMKKRAARAQARQAKTNKENETDVAMVNAEQSHLNSTLPQGAGYDEALDLWLPGTVPTPAATAPAPPTKPEAKKPGVVPGESVPVE